MTDKPKMGRPPKPPEDKMQTYSVRLTLEQIAKLRAIGMDRLRAWIDRAKVKE
jgi:hypothetical protein